jgi:beta-galactosidase
LKKDIKVAILFSTDSSNAIAYMPFSDRVDYQTVLSQMWNALYDLNVEADFVQAGNGDVSRYKLLMVPPLYSVSDAVLRQIAEYVKAGGHVVMAFKSGFTDEYSTVRHVMAPGPLREAAGFHYQEFSSLAEPVPLTPDPFHAAGENKASVWAEFLLPDTAEVLASLDDTTWRFPVITRNRYGDGTLTYEATVVTDALQREIVRDAISRAGLAGEDQKLPPQVKIRQGRNGQGRLLRYYFNFSEQDACFTYPYATGVDLLTGYPVEKGVRVNLRPWGVAVIAER